MIVPLSISDLWYSLNLQTSAFNTKKRFNNMNELIRDANFQKFGCFQNIIDKIPIFFSAIKTIHSWYDIFYIRISYILSIGFSYTLNSIWAFQFYCLNNQTFKKCTTNWRKENIEIVLFIVFLSLFIFCVFSPFFFFYKSLTFTY